MSHFATPFIAVNLGCEMIYVIEQRLKAQNITAEKSEREELFIPQPVATHAVVKQLLQDISATSIMKLDDYSMSKLWDLMTMIFKWQLAVATNQNIFDITRRHLKSVATVMPKNFPKCIIEHTMRKFDALAQHFTDDDYKCLSNTLILWFSEYHTKISVLLRLGLQRKDGENIYKYDHKKNSIEEYESRCADTNEISCLLRPIEQASSVKTKVELQLPIELYNKESEKKTIEINRDTQFETIVMTQIRNRATDLNFVPDIPKSPHEDLLEMMEKLDVS